MLLAVLKELIMSKGESHCPYEPYGIEFSRSAYVASMQYPNMFYITFGGDMYIKDDGNRNMKRIVA